MDQHAMRWKAQLANGLVSCIKAKQILGKMEPTNIFPRSSELKILFSKMFYFNNCVSGSFTKLCGIAAVLNFWQPNRPTCSALQVTTVAVICFRGKIDCITLEVLAQGETLTNIKVKPFKMQFGFLSWKYRAIEFHNGTISHTVKGITFPKTSMFLSVLCAVQNSCFIPYLKSAAIWFLQKDNRPFNSTKSVNCYEMFLFAFQALFTLDHAITFLAAWRMSILSSACVRETAAMMESLCVDQMDRFTPTIARWK